MSVFLDLMWYFRTHKLRYIGGILLLICVSLVNLVPPQIVGGVVEQIKNKTLTHSSLLSAVSMIALVAGASYIFRFLWRYLLFGGSVGLSRLLRNRLFEHFTKMSPSFYNNHRVGDLMAHATNDVQAIEATAGEGVLTLVDSITTGTVVIVTMATTLNWLLTLLVLIPMPFMAYATSRYGGMLHKRFHKAQEAFAEITEKVQENISGMRVVKAFGQESIENMRFQEISEDVVQKNIAVAKIDALFDPTISFIVGICYFLSISLGAVFVVHGQLTIGGLTTFTLYLGQLIWPMLAFGWLFNIVERGRASNDRVRALLDVVPSIVNHPFSVDITPSGAVLFEVESFSYPTAMRPALKGIYLTLQQGQTLGIVGKTGSGKTTLLRLLLREFDCVDGKIQIGQHALSQLTLNGLRSATAYVPQDHFLFSATISENIAFGNPAASTDDILAASRSAAIHEDILRFSEGYETVVGERGVTLSGGQKQRISIARALLLDAEILILDDSLSAVDAKTEQSILDALRANRKGKTTLISAHRLSAIEHADVIIVLDEGQISEQGCHAELMSRRGWYHAMYERQQLESLVEHGGFIA